MLQNSQGKNQPVLLRSLMNLDVKKVVKKIGKLEATLKNKIESGALFNEAKKFAEGQVKILRQKAKTSKDAKKVMTFIDQRKKQIEKVAADLPRDVKNVKSFIQTQKKELSRLRDQLLKQVKDAKIKNKSLKMAINITTGKKAAKTSAKKTTSKKTARKK
jgi:hypothetical protein